MIEIRPTGARRKQGFASTLARLGLRAFLALATLSVVLLGFHAPAARADLSFDQHMVDLLNADRAANGVGPLLWGPTLGSIAESAPYGGCGFQVSGRAADMGVRNYFGHTIANCGSQNVFSMLGAFGVPYSSAGENLAWMAGQTDPIAAADSLNTALMNDAPHRANILNPAFNFVGVGSWQTGPGQTWSGGTGSPLANAFITSEIFATLPQVIVSPPGAPGNVLASPGDGRANVTWATAPAGSAPTDSYGLLAYDAAGYANVYASACATCTSGTVSGLTNGHSYYVVAYAHNAAGWGAPANSGWVTPGIPNSLTNLTVTPGDSGANLSWALAGAPAGMAVDGYGILVYDASGYTGQAISACATCKTGNLSGLTNGHSYYVVAYAHNAAGWSAPTTSPWFTPGLPTAPSNLVATRGSNKATATWNLAKAPATLPIDAYGVLAYDASGYAGFYASACATCTTATVTGLTNGHGYYLLAYAHNAAGWGAAAGSAWFTPGP